MPNKRVQVPVGMLRNDDRLLIAISQGEQIPIIMCSLHACLFKDHKNKPDCVEPWDGQAVVATYNSEAIFLAQDALTVRVPWRSAVQCWRPDLAPSKPEREAIVRMYSHGKKEVPHT